MFGLYDKMGLMIKVNTIQEALKIASVHQNYFKCTVIIRRIN